jgi:hypothetical protein
LPSSFTSGAANDHDYAVRSVLAMALFPTSFFFLAVYAESLALVLALLAAYFLLRGRPAYLAAGLALGVVSATRPVGWLLPIGSATVLVVFTMWWASGRWIA